MIDFEFRDIHDRRCVNCNYVVLNTGHDTPKAERRWHCKLHSDVDFKMRHNGLYNANANDSTCNDWMKGMINEDSNL